MQTVPLPYLCRTFANLKVPGHSGFAVPPVPSVPLYRPLGVSICSYSPPPRSDIRLNMARTSARARPAGQKGAGATEGTAQARYQGFRPAEGTAKGTAAHAEGTAAAPESSFALVFWNEEVPLAPVLSTC